MSKTINVKAVVKESFRLAQLDLSKDHGSRLNDSDALSKLIEFYQENKPDG